MKILYGTVEELQAVDSAIVTAMVVKFHSHMNNWTDIEHDSDGYYILLNENELPNPLQFLSEAELARLENYDDSNIGEQENEF